MLRFRIAIVIAALAALTLTASAGAALPKLVGTVGPGFTITLKQNGKPVKTLKAGTYSITVTDKSDIHNFRLRGPGLNKEITAIDFEGTKTVVVTLKKGTYTYVCDPHFTIDEGELQGRLRNPLRPGAAYARYMNRKLARSLLAATAALVAAGVGAAAPPKLIGTVGPGFTISLKQGGKLVKTLKAGTYTIVVSDKASIHDFHLKGPGVNKVITDVGFTGTKTVTVTLKKGTYPYFCDPHATTMHGSFKVT